MNGPGGVTSSLRVVGTFSGSRGVFGCFPGLTGEFCFRPVRALRGAGRGVSPGGGVAVASLRPRCSLQTARVGRERSILSLPPALTPAFFPVLQILGSSSSGNAGRKLAREGGGGWKFLAAPLLCACVCVRARLYRCMSVCV